MQKIILCGALTCRYMNCWYIQLTNILKKWFERFIQVLTNLIINPFMKEWYATSPTGGRNLSAALWIYIFTYSSCVFSTIVLFLEPKEGLALGGYNPFLRPTIYSINGIALALSLWMLSTWRCTQYRRPEYMPHAVQLQFAFIYAALCSTGLP